MTDKTTDGSADPSSTRPPAGALGRLDAWMGQHPAHPRAAPFLTYCVFLGLIGYLVRPHAPALWPLAYVLQNAAVLWLLWRYRRLMPELTLRFHWMALPVGAAVAAMWVAVGLWMVQTFPGQFAADDAQSLARANLPLRHLSLALELVGISVVVPMLEEPFVRSFVLRALHRFRPMAAAAVQIAQELPLVGNWLRRTSLGRQTEGQDHILADQFDATPLGKLSVFGVAASTLIFMLYHVPRDWPAAIVCGIAYCLLLAATRKKGLGPLVWAHGITNALLFAYCAWEGDWQFL